MAYSKLGWTSNQSPDVNGANLTHMDNGIFNNDAAISIHTGDIEAIANDADANTADIAVNRTLIVTNQEGIAANIVDITANTTAIEDNYNTTAANKDDIATNTANIATNTSRSLTNTSEIDNISDDVQRNTSDIDKNTSDIASLSAGESAQGGWTPKSGNEYPTSPQVGESWYVSSVPSIGYTFTTGDLTGYITYNMDKMIYTDLGWSLIEANLTTNIPSGIVNTIISPLFSMQLKNNIDMNGVGASVYSRSGTATFIDRYGTLKTADSDTPRFESDGILMEGISTNELIDTADASQYYTMNTVYSTDGTLNPDGITLAGLFTGDGISGEHHCSVLGTPTSGDKSLSVFVKKGSAPIIHIAVYATGGSGNLHVFTDFNFDTEETTGSAVHKLANGWYRIESDGLLEVTDQDTYSFRVHTDNGGITTNTTSVYVYGQQIEESDTPSSYIATGSTTETRNPDNLTFEYYNNFPGWDKPFSIVFDYWKPTAAEVSNNFILSNGTTTNGYINQAAIGAITFSVLDGSFCSIPFPGDKARVVCVSDGVTTSIYENGIFINSGEVGTGVWDGSDTMKIGQDAFQNLSDFKIYDKALTEDEISFMGGI